MNHHGYCSDYLNPGVFQEATFENGLINYGPMSYQAVIICQMQTTSPEFVDALTKYAKSGGKIIFIETVPQKGPGMKFKDTDEVENKSKQLVSNYPNNVLVTDSPPQNLNDFTKWTGNLLESNGVKPGVKISHPHEHLFIYQSEYEGKPIFFFSNQNRNVGIQFEATFDSNGLKPWIWDAETGKKSPVNLKNNTIQFGLETLESALIVFSEEEYPLKEKENSEIKMVSDVWKGDDISHDWTAECIPPEEEPFTIQIPELKDLSKIKETENFGGTIIYKKTIPYISKTYKELDLGKVAETAEVTLNGKNLGVRWWGDKKFDISQARVDGENELEIKVTTLLWNYCNSKTMEENPMAKLWAERNRNKENKPLPVGLIGPVIIST
jgi:hypothetical protein